MLFLHSPSGKKAQASAFGFVDAGTSDNTDANSGTQKEEWMAVFSQLFIGKKFSSGSNSRISRGIYKQRAVAVKMVKIPDQDEKRREMELTLTKGEMPI